MAQNRTQNRPIRSLIFWQLLETLVPGEWQVFERRYLQSHRAKPSDVEQLYTFWKQHHNSDPEISQAEVWRVMFPNKPFHARHLRSIGHDLAQLVRSFLSSKHLAENAGYHTLCVLEELRNRNQIDAFLKEWKRLQRQLKAKPVRDQEWFYLRYRSFEIAQPIWEVQNDKFLADKLKEGRQAFETYGILVRLENEIFWRSYARKFNLPTRPPEAGDLGEIAPHLRQIPSVSLRIHMLALELEPWANESVDPVISLLRENRQVLSFSDRYNAFGALANWYGRQLRIPGDINRLVNYWRWVREILIQPELPNFAQYFLIDGKMSASHFRNFLKAALYFSDVHTARFMLNRLIGYVPSSYRNDTADLGEILLDIELGNYSAAKKRAHRFESEDARWKFYVKMEHLKASLLGEEKPDATYYLQQIRNIRRQLARMSDQFISRYQAEYEDRLDVLRTLIKAKSREEVYRVKQLLPTKYPVATAHWLQKIVSHYLAILRPTATDEHL